MANFRLTNTPPPIWNGGPPTVCAICKFTNPYPWYVELQDVFAEQGYDMPPYGRVEATHPIILCSDHALELKATLDEIAPDDRLAKAQGAILQAEAARARAEKRAEKAETALYAMQDWQGGQQVDPK